MTSDLVNTSHHSAKQALHVKFAHARTETHCNILHHTAARCNTGKA